MLQPEPSSSGQHPGARCAEHVDRPAISICTRCGTYACVLCRNEGPDGLEYCERCTPAMSSVLAEPGTRFVANLVDSFAIILPMLGSLFLGGMLSAVTGNEEEALFGILVLLGVLASLGVLGYQLYLLSELGQTLGKRMMGIKVVRTDGSPVNLGRLILLRNLVPGAINSACGLFSFIDALFIFAADRRCLHDHIADTKVVKVNEHTR
jgi:uncharacterized RDD family membrane protein YckC